MSDETSTSTHDQAKNILNMHRLRVHRKARAQYLMSRSLLAMNTRLGIPVIVLTTLVGTATFTSVGESQNSILAILTGLVSISAAVLAALQTFLRFSERSENHRVSANAYSNLKRQMDLAMVEIDTIDSISAAMTLVRELIDKIAELDVESVEASDKFYDRAKREQSDDLEGV